MHKQTGQSFHPNQLRPGVGSATSLGTRHVTFNIAM